MAEAQVGQKQPQAQKPPVAPPAAGVGPAEAGKKKTTEYIKVKMEDGRDIDFPASRKVQKEVLIDEAKVKVTNDGAVVFQPGAVAVRMDFANGKTRTLPLASELLAQFAGHGASQKYGDQLASTKDKPMSLGDMVLAIEELHEQLYVKKDWTTVSEGGGGFAGASIVVQAIVEASGKTLDQVKAYLQKKLDDAKAKGEKLSRKELYDSFRNPNSKTGKIIKRMEEEALSKNSKLDADAELNAI